MPQKRCLDEGEGPRATEHLPVLLTFCAGSAFTPVLNKLAVQADDQRQATMELTAEEPVTGPSPATAGRQISSHTESTDAAFEMFENPPSAPREKTFIWNWIIEWDETNGHGRLHCRNCETIR